MKFRINAPVVAAFAVGVMAAGGFVWAASDSFGSDEQWCRTKAGYLRMSSSGECRRSEVPVDLPQGPQGEQGIQGEPGAKGQDADLNLVDTLRCSQQPVVGADLHGCTLPTSRFVGTIDFTGADLSGITVQALSLRAATITVGDRFACSLTLTHSVQCWGRIYNGDVREYVPVAVPSALVKARQVTAGGAHVCAMRLDRTVLCWGYVWNGSSHRPIVVPDDLGQVASLFVGPETDCAVQVSGQVRCWGWNASGVAEPPADLEDVTDIAIGAYHACALVEGGTARCWGRFNVAGLEIPSGMGKLQHVVSSRLATCFVNVSGVVRCVSDNSNASGVASVPQSLPKAAAIAVRDAAACAIDEFGVTRCWGSSPSLENIGKVATDPLSTFAMSETTSCGLYGDGTVNCYRDDGQPIPIPSNLTSLDGARESTVSLENANLEGADLSAVRIGLLMGCGIQGDPVAMPIGWQLIGGCVQHI